MERSDTDPAILAQLQQLALECEIRAGAGIHRKKLVELSPKLRSDVRSEWLLQQCSLEGCSVLDYKVRHPQWQLEFKARMRP